MKTSSDNSWMDKTVSYNPCPRCKSGILDTRIARGKIVKHLFFGWKLKDTSVVIA